MCCNSLSSGKVRAIPYALTLASIGIFLAFDTSDDRQEDMSRGVILIRTLKLLSDSEICQSKINSRWFAGPIGQMNRRPSV